MRKCQRRKLRDEIVALLIAIIGAVLVVKHIFDMAPVIALIGAVILIFGLSVFADIRNKKYHRKSKKARR